MNSAQRAAMNSLFRHRLATFATSASLSRAVASPLIRPSPLAAAGRAGFFTSTSTARTGLSRYLPARRGYRVYNPQRFARRSIIDEYPDAPVYAILGINGAVFALWQYAREDLRQFRNPGWMRFMDSHFLLNWANATARPWTVVTSNFSHADFGHLLVNMFVLHSFGTTVCQTLGARSFLTLYGLAVLGTSAASLAYAKYNERRLRQQLPRGWMGDRMLAAAQPRGSLGASGCTMSIAALYACMFPTSSIYLFLVVPVPAWACVAGFMGYDLYRAATRTGAGTDVAGHLGGGFTGLAFWALAMRRGARFARY
ncbi:hypothetical protein H9P43_009717 [Blastocladiella emersonii ATCC 22665]|nr:hypothetical protein H9P43_009717 [Blastocladiella emersonii ATCC 22665]